MKYTVVSCRPKDAEKTLSTFATQGWKVISQSETAWPIKKCFGLSNTVDAIINFTLGKE